MKFLPRPRPMAMSRRCCPREEEGMAWGRGRWGCMAPNEQSQQGEQLMRRNRRFRPSLCNSWGLLRIRGTVSSSTYNLLYKLRGCLLSHPVFSRLFPAFKQPLIDLRPCLPLPCTVPPLLYSNPHTGSPLGSNNPWISHVLLQAHLFTNRRIPVAPLQPPYYILLFVQDSMWQAIIPSSSVCFGDSFSI